MIDQSRARDVWGGGSTAMKRGATREDFATHVELARAQLGKPTGREWTWISMQAVESDDMLPQGRYVSVGFVTDFENGNAREIVSLRQDEGGWWRVTGYVLK